MDLDKLLEPTGLKYEELTPVEKETLNTWTEELKDRKVTIEGIKKHIFDMKAAVEEKLAQSDTKRNDDIYLKARLRNYLLLEAMLVSYDKAKEAIDNQLKGFLRR